MPIIEQAVPPGFEGDNSYIVEAKYDFALQGGAIGTIGLTGGLVIPTGFTVWDGFIDVVTTVTSGGAATFGIQVEAAGDIVAAGSGFGLLTAGRKNVLPGLVSASATANTSVVRTTAKRDISLVIAAAALTAGKFKVVLVCFPALAN